MKWLIILSLLSQTLAAPTLPSLPGPRQGATFQDVLDDVWQNTLKAGYSKAAVIQFLGDTSVNAAVESLKVGTDYVKGIGIKTQFYSLFSVRLKLKLIL